MSGARLGASWNQSVSDDDVGATLLTLCAQPICFSSTLRRLAVHPLACEAASQSANSLAEKLSDVLLLQAERLTITSADYHKLRRSAAHSYSQHNIRPLKLSSQRHQNSSRLV
eukprot:6174671-Pleurochrysis_carterae.AAC.3